MPSPLQLNAARPASAPDVTHLRTVDGRGLGDPLERKRAAGALLRDLGHSAESALAQNLAFDQHQRAGGGALRSSGGGRG